MRIRSTLAVSFAAAALVLAGCGSSGDTTDDATATPTVEPTEATSPTESPTESPTSTATTSSLCSESAILGALPESAEMVSYTCADVSGTEWAAAKVNPGPTVFFLQASGDTWDVSTSDEICGTASAGLPSELLDYCE